MLTIITKRVRQAGGLGCFWSIIFFDSIIPMKSRNESCLNGFSSRSLALMRVSLRALLLKRPYSLCPPINFSDFFRSSLSIYADDRTILIVNLIDSIKSKQQPIYENDFQSVVNWSNKWVVNCDASKTNPS